MNSNPIISKDFVRSDEDPAARNQIIGQESNAEE